MAGTGIITCSNCAQETTCAALVCFEDIKVNAIHFSYCMTALSPFPSKYEMVIRKEHPDLALVMEPASPSIKRISDGG